MKHIIFFAIALMSNVLFSMDETKSITVFNHGLSRVFVIYSSDNQWHKKETIDGRKQATIDCARKSKIQIYEKPQHALSIPVDTVKSSMDIFLEEDDAISAVYSNKS